MRKTYLYYTSADAWLLLDSTKTMMGTGQPSAVWEGKAYINGESEAFDVATLKWVPAGVPPGAMEYHSYMAFTDNRILYTRTDGVITEPFGRPRAPFTTHLWSWQPHAGTWESPIPVRAGVEGMTMETIANRLFLFTGDFGSPMETFEYFLP